MGVLKTKVDVKDRHQNPKKLRPVRDDEEPEPEEAPPDSAKKESE